MLKRFLKSRQAQMAGAWLLGSYLAFALRTTRWTIEGAEHVSSGALILAFWHERLPMMPALWNAVRHVQPAREVGVLVSRHRDGRLIGAIMERFHMRLVYASSEKPGEKRSGGKGGAAGLRALLAHLARGDAIAITPDGPRGPRRHAAEGVVQLASLARLGVVAAAGQTRRRITLRSWDRMVLPLPFGRGALVCLAPIAAGRHDPTALPAITAALNQAAARADLLCGIA